MKHSDIFSWIGSIFGTIGTALQTDEVLRYISLGLTILSTLFAISYTIWKWWKKASQDGKITKEEVDEVMDDIHQIIDKKGEDEDGKD